MMHIGDVGITVSKKHCGKSIGMHMMKCALEWVLWNNLTKLQLQVRTDNERAIKLYEKFGSRIEGTITQPFNVGGVYFDDYIMSFDLGSKITI